MTVVRLKRPLDAGQEIEAVLPTLEEIEAAEQSDKEKDA